VGLEEIDAQHRYLFDLIAELHTHADSAVTDRTARNLLREIDRYCYYHFNSEETLMEIYAYPDINKQKEERFTLLQVLDKRICDFRQEGKTVRPISEFLFGLLLAHMQGDDLVMAKHIHTIRKARVGVPKRNKIDGSLRETHKYHNAEISALTARYVEQS
jgi:hemerythrin